MSRKPKLKLLYFTIASLMAGAIVVVFNPGKNAAEMTRRGETIAQSPATNAPQLQCPAADWPALKKEIETRYAVLETSLDQMVAEVKDPDVDQVTINSQSQLAAIDSLILCLNSPQVTPDAIQKRDEIIDFLEKLKNNVLLAAESGLTGDNLLKLKNNVGLTNGVDIIGDDFIKVFTVTIDTYKKDIKSAISALPDSQVKNTSTPKDRPASTSTPVSDLRGIAGSLFLIIGGILGISSVIFLIRHSGILKGRETPTLPQPNDVVISQEISNLKSQVNQINEKFNVIETNLSELKKLVSKNESHQNLSSQQTALEQEIVNLKRQLNDKFKIVEKILSKLIDTSSYTIEQPLQSSPVFIPTSAPTSVPPPIPPVSPSFKPAPPPQPLPTASKTPENLSTQLIDTYNTNSDFLKSKAMGVSETEGSFAARRSGFQMPMIFELNANQPRFWICNDRFLVPFPKFKITTHRLNTISGAFNHHDFSSGCPFELIQPAIVSKMSDGSDRWQLVQKGEINFLTESDIAIDN